MPLFGLAPRLAVYLMSFLTLGIFWIGQQTQLNNLSHADRDLTWIHLAFLFAVTVMPFSTGLMAEFTHYRTALVIYWANILVLGILLLASWRYAGSAGLVRDEMAPETARSIECRIILAPGALRVRRNAFDIQHHLEHRVYRARATELCGSTEDRRVTPLVGRLRGARPA